MSKFQNGRYWPRCLAGSTLDEYAVQIYDITRNPGESDAELRRRCAQKFDLLQVQQVLIRQGAERGLVGIKRAKA